MMHFSKNVQYVVSGLLAAYIVFFTRPAPHFVASALSSPIAQLAVLAAIVYVGACMSLLVALVASVALVLSMPAREYLDEKDMKAAKDSVKDIMNVGMKAAAGEASDKLATAAGKPKSKNEPEPAGHKVADSVAHAEPTGSSKKEGFDGGAPF